MLIDEKFALVSNEMLAQIDEDYINYIDKRIPEYISKLSPEEIKERYLAFLKKDAILEYLDKEVPERKE